VRGEDAIPAPPSSRAAVDDAQLTAGQREHESPNEQMASTPDERGRSRSRCSVMARRPRVRCWAPSATLAGSSTRLARNARLARFARIMAERPPIHDEAAGDITCSLAPDLDTSPPTPPSIRPTAGLLDPIPICASCAPRECDAFPPMTLARRLGSEGLSLHRNGDSRAALVATAARRRPLRRAAAAD